MVAIDDCERCRTLLLGGRARAELPREEAALDLSERGRGQARRVVGSRVHVVHVPEPGEAPDDVPYVLRSTATATCGKALPGVRCLLATDEVEDYARYLGLAYIPSTAPSVAAEAKGGRYARGFYSLRDDDASTATVYFFRALARKAKVVLPEHLRADPENGFASFEARRAARNEILECLGPHTVYARKLGQEKEGTVESAEQKEIRDRALIIEDGLQAVVTFITLGHGPGGRAEFAYMDAEELTRRIEQAERTDAKKAARGSRLT